MERGRSRSHSVESYAENGRKDKDKDSISIHFPWLSDYEREAKECLSGETITLVDVLKLLTSLERLVSPEVSKLKTRPNRATKFLTQLKKKISLVKMAGLMSVSGDDDHALYPLYGLLLTHFVNITLLSSKNAKLSTQQVATEIYYLLKLIFDGETEFILDVALCSNLDEHATSKYKIGYEFFSYIVEDWRLFSTTLACQLKYSAICSLLSAACSDGEVFVSKHLPHEPVHNNFIKFMHGKNIDIGEHSGGTRKVRDIKGLVKVIKPIQVKSLSRQRLVIVYKRDITGDRNSSSDSNCSTVDTPATSVEKCEMPSSSINNYPTIPEEDPVQQLLGELGIGGDFYIDTQGTNHSVDQNGMTRGESYDYECMQYAMDDPVSSSRQEDNDDNDMEVDDTSEESPSVVSLTVNAPSPRPCYKVSYKSQATAAAATERQSSQDKVKKSRTNRKRYISDEGESEEDRVVFDYEKKKKRVSGYTENSEDEDEGKPGIESDEEKEEEESTSKEKQNEEENEDDSDLEVLSVISADEVQSKNDGEENDAPESPARDEAEAESGEDEVPNYDEDSDEENMMKGKISNQDTEDQAVGSTADSEKEPSDKEVDNKAEEGEEEPSKSQSSVEVKEKEAIDEEGAESDISEHTVKLSVSPAKKNKKEEEDGIEEETQKVDMDSENDNAKDETVPSKSIASPSFSRSSKPSNSASSDCSSNNSSSASETVQPSQTESTSSSEKIEEVDEDDEDEVKATPVKRGRLGAAKKEKQSPTNNSPKSPARVTRAAGRGRPRGILSATPRKNLAASKEETPVTPRRATRSSARINK